MKLRAYAMAGVAALAMSLAAMIPAQAGVPYQQGDVFAGIGLGQIRHMDNLGNLIQVLNTTSGSAEDAGMCFDAAGNLYSTNFTAQNMSKFDADGDLLVHPWATGFSLRPESCVVDAAGNIYTGEVDGAQLIRKFDAAGNLLATFAPATGPRGVDWIDLAADQCTMYYTSEGSVIRRFDVCTNTQLADFATGLTPPCFALRIRAGGEVLVACGNGVVRLDAAGNPIQTYTDASLGTNFLFALNLDPDGTSFWTADISTGRTVRVDIATGAVITAFNTPISGFSLAGLAIFGEPTQAGGGPLQKEITSGPDEDGDGVVDVVVPKKPILPLEYDFTITYNNPDGPPVLVVDTLPAEWIAKLVNGIGVDVDECGEADFLDETFGMVDIFKHGQLGKKCQSATEIEWMPVTGATGRLFAATDNEEFRFTFPPDRLYRATTSGPNVINSSILNPVDGGGTFHPVNGLGEGPGFLFAGQPQNVGGFPGNTLRRLDYNGNVLSSVLGNFLPGCCNEEMVLLGGTLYHATFPTVIQELDPNTGLVTATHAQSDVVGMAVINGQIWISKWSARLVGTWNPGTNVFTPMFSTSPVPGTNIFANAGALAWDPGGQVLWLGLQGGLVIPVDLTGTPVGPPVQPFGAIPDTIDGLAFVPGSDLRIDSETRESPGGGHKQSVFAPTSCGPLYLNDGAVAFEKDEEGNIVLDENGDPVIVAGPTPPLCLAVVDQDLLSGGEPRDDQFDHDGDGLSSWAEACSNEERTDPCLEDTDGDGVIDGEDLCPLQGPADPSLGQIPDTDLGCWRQSECSDDVDNEGDGPIDFPADLSCTSITDDSEDTIDP